MRKILDEATGLEVTHQVDTFEGLSRHARDLPDVVVIGCLADVPRPSVAARRFLDSSPTASVLVVDDSADAAGHVLPDAPRVGVLPLSSGPDEFLSAIRMLAAGYAFFARPDYAGPPEPRSAERGRPPLERITRRETDVLRLLVCGQTNSEMARRLSLTESTVKFHVQNLLRKLRLPNRASAVAYAYETGLINVGELSETARRP
ncbi:DNA-binding NarL/FixJ family response regulator [Saccharothrix tamanrassetensis]|uniref:DNA-binding NarL/FixJ family response regulator n=1 Tax=Saccharothrix tamanrassetensis TaxID=1051531 RepID=A0A841CTQ8_9PSEU|nr:response regulator transcription factor [Saccharothrix tamanrassetensis]MBB5959518.1 DNA-binding NarL/FixJ family response regulator [Saccharothrix tamanrassetensis]